MPNDLSDLGNLLSAALAAFSIASLAGLGWVSGNVKRIRQDNADLEERDKRRKAELDEVKLDRDRLKTDLEALARVVQGEVHWTAISDQLNHHNDEAKTHWEAEHALLREIRDELATRRQDHK